MMSASFSLIASSFSLSRETYDRVLAHVSRQPLNACRKLADFIPQVALVLSHLVVPFSLGALVPAPRFGVCGTSPVPTSRIYELSVNSPIHLSKADRARLSALARGGWALGSRAPPLPQSARIRPNRSYPRVGVERAKPPL
jgi:hypothetical protein